LTATIPAANLASVGTAQVSVVNGNPGGGTSTSGTQTFTILAPPAGTTWVRAVAGIAEPKCVVWDATHGNLYVSVSSSDPLIPNTIVPVNPVTGVAGTPVAAGNNPNLLSLSSDSSYLWAGVDGDNAVQRFVLPSLTKDISFPVPLDWLGRPLQANSLQAAPVSPHTVALVAGNRELGFLDDGAYIYDDATQRPIYVPGPIPGPGVEIDWLQWGANDSTIYGNSFGGETDTLTVTSSGVSRASGGAADVYIAMTQYVRGDGLLYSLNGAFNPKNASLMGTFDLPPFSFVACTADSSLNRYYCVESFSLGGSDVQEFDLLVYDLTSRALVDRILFGLSAGTNKTSITGQPIWLVRWGNAGLALVTFDDTLRGNGGLYLIDGAAVNPNVAPDATSGTAAAAYSWMTSISPQQISITNSDVTVTVNGTNFTPDSAACYSDCALYVPQQDLPTAYVSPQQLKVTIPASVFAQRANTIGPISLSVFDPGTNTLSTNALGLTTNQLTISNAQVTALNLAGLALAWDPNDQLLYVGVADWDAAHPNTILALDGQSGAIVKAQNVASDPDLLSVSANSQYLYAVFAGSTNMTQFQLPGLGSPVTSALDTPAGTGILYAEDMKSAPENPHATAVTLIAPGTSPQCVGGIVIYDDGVMRPTYAPPGWAAGTPAPQCFDTVAWGPTDQVLTSASAPPDSTGPLYGLQVSSSGVTYSSQGTTTFNEYGELHSDFGTGLIYSDDGNVADPNTQAIVGAYGASGLVYPDSSLNLVFILGQTAAQAQTNSYTIQSFDERAYTPVSGITLNSLLGIPIALSRWGTSGLAVLTMNTGSGPAGMLYLIQDSSFVTGAQAGAFRTSEPQELVQRRWKPISTVDILRMIHAKSLKPTVEQGDRSKSAIQRFRTNSVRRKDEGIR
jgi:hypothetical protein